MPWAGGVYTRGYPSWSADAAGNLPISATKFDTEDNDFAAGVNFCLAKDGSNEPTSTLTWVLASAPPIALTRTTTDGTVFSLARTGGANNPNFTFAVGDTAGLTIAGTSGGLNLLNNGNVSIAAPAAGVALTAAGFANSYTAILTASSTSGQSLGLQVNAGTTSADFALSVRNQAGTTTFLSIDGSGRQITTVPDNVKGITVNVASAAQGSSLSWQNSGVERGFIGTGPGTLAGAALGDFIIGADTGVLRFAVGAATAMSIANTGSVTIVAPSSGNALSATGLAGNYAGAFSGSASVGQSRGILVAAGTNNSDFVAVFANQGNSVNYVLFYGDGGVTVGTPTGGDPGLGIVNAKGFQIDSNPVYAGIPQNAPNVNYTTVLSDANKNLTHTSGAPHTYTIAANASVAYPIGSAITFTTPTGAGVLTIAINTDTLQWSPSAGTGSRTLAACGIATAIKVASTTWMISGSGLS